MDFSFSPTTPRTGELVRFSNHSEEGEEWAWSFGDLGTSSSKNPVHVYKQPGEYTVTLVVDGKEWKKRSKQVTVYDSIPTFACADTMFEVYRDYCYKAMVYNPYQYELSYRWAVEGVDAVLNDSTSHSCTLHFLEAGEATVVLSLTFNGEQSEIRKTYTVVDRPAKSVVMRTSEGDWRQRIYEDYFAVPLADTNAYTLLDARQDTLQTYNGQTFRLSEMAEIFVGITGFEISGRKVYYRTNEGLYVANLSGTNIVQISDESPSALAIDNSLSRLYWATETGMYYLPLIGSDNNQFTTSPSQINQLKTITKIAIDNNSK